MFGPSAFLHVNNATRVPALNININNSNFSRTELSYIHVRVQLFFFCHKGHTHICLCLCIQVQNEKKKTDKRYTVILFTIPNRFGHFFISSFFKTCVCVHVSFFVVDKSGRSTCPKIDTSATAFHKSDPVPLFG